MRDYDECPGCGDGDKVPARGYWQCPICDAEWDDSGEIEEANSDPKAPAASERLLPSNPNTQGE